MNALSSDDVKALNNLSMARKRDLSLGTVLQTLIGQQIATGTPVNAAAAAMELAVSSVVIHGETVVINNPAVAGLDTYVFFAADPLMVLPPVGNIVVDITPHVGFGTRNLTIDTQPTAGDTMTIGERTYIFVPEGTDDGNNQIGIGTDLASAQLKIAQAINGADDHNLPNTQVRLGAFETNVSAVTALIGGTVGNGIALTETFTANGNVFSGVSTAGGTNCSAANACAHLIAAITASDTQGVGAAAGEGDTVELTADVAGAAGNNIALAETMANGAFTGGAVSMFGGVNGTVGSPLQLMYDASYLYVCVAPNTVAGKNWRRVSLGAAY